MTLRRKSTIPRLATIVCLLLASALLPAAARAQIGASEDAWVFPRNWSAPLPSDLAKDRIFAVYTLNLFSAGMTDGRLRVSRAPMNKDGFADAPRSLRTDGIPDAFRVTAMEINAGLRQILLAGDLNGTPTVLRGHLTPDLDAADWKPLPPFPQKYNETVTSIRLYDEHALLFTSRETPEGNCIAGWAANIGAPDDKLVWLEIPPVDPSRSGHSLGLMRGLTLLVGGNTPDNPDFPAEMRRLNFDKSSFGSWQPAQIPTDRRLREAVGAAYGAALLVAPRAPAPAADDKPTSQSVMMLTDLGGGRLSAWRELVLAQAAAPIRALVLDPGHSRFLIIGESDSPLVSAYDVPAFLMAPRKTEEDVLLERYDKALPTPIAVDRDEALSAARDEHRYALLVITSGDRKEEVEARLLLSSNQFRYMTYEMKTVYQTGPEGAATLREFGIARAPAFVLIDPDGRVAKSITGKIPSHAELLELTSPAREAKGEPTPTPAPTP